MATRTQFAEAAKREALLIAEYKGEVQGIGEREELEALISDGVLPQGSVIREAVPSDF